MGKCSVSITCNLLNASVGPRQLSPPLIKAVKKVSGHTLAHLAVLSRPEVTVRDGAIELGLLILMVKTVAFGEGW